MVFIMAITLKSETFRVHKIEENSTYIKQLNLELDDIIQFECKFETYIQEVIIKNISKNKSIIKKSYNAIDIFKMDSETRYGKILLKPVDEPIIKPEKSGVF